MREVRGLCEKSILRRVQLYMPVASAVDATSTESRGIYSTNPAYIYIPSIPSTSYYSMYIPGLYNICVTIISFAI